MKSAIKQNDLRVVHILNDAVHILQRGDVRVVVDENEKEIRFQYVAPAIRKQRPWFTETRYSFQTVRIGLTVEGFTSLIVCWLNYTVFNMSTSRKKIESVVSVIFN